ncbi:MAG: 4Fe-4S dicluster domain-containing protein [Actinobacteria bacterium]|nr:4Fe-4S dicluster domain-containing protein [Actinomycetota bacterium]
MTTESDKHPASSPVAPAAAHAPAADLTPAEREGTTSEGPGDARMIIAASTFCPRAEEHRDLVQRILDDPRMHDHREGFLSCIQCGICTSGCPAARFTEFSPREVARRALDGDETLLTDDSLWYCFSCYTCQSRCPRHNSVAVINQVIRGLQVESGYGRKHVAMFAEWCAAFYEKGAGGDPHVQFAAIRDAWGAEWVEYMEHLVEFRTMLGLGPLFPPDDAVAEVRAIMEETGFIDRLEQVSGKRIRAQVADTEGRTGDPPPSPEED